MILRLCDCCGGRVYRNMADSITGNVEVKTPLHMDPQNVVLAIQARIANKDDGGQLCPSCFNHAIRRLSSIGWAAGG